MSNNNYYVKTAVRSAVPRSKRLRDGASRDSSGAAVTSSQLSSNLTSKIALLCSWFDQDSQGNIFVTKDALDRPRSFYSYGNVTAGGNGGGGEGGSSTLYSLNDVYHSGQNILRTDGTPKQDGDFLAYSSAQGKWVAMAGSASGVTSISVNGGAAQTGAVSLTIPTALASLTADATHRLVTDTEKATWNGKQDASTAITTSNIGQQSVNYAASAGNASQLGGLGEARYFRKNLIHESADCNTMEGNSLTVLDQDAGSTICSNKPADAFIDGGYGVLTVSHGSYKNQLFFPYGAGADQLYLRSSYFSGGVVWSGWNKIWHSGNCNNTSTPWSASSLNLGTGGLTFTETGAAYLDKWGNVHMVATSGAWSVNVPSIGEALHVDVNGNVGIGTSSPQEKLDVSGGNIRVTGASTDTRSYELTNGVYLWQLSHRGSNYSNRIGIYNCSGGTWSSELLTISTNGNVGIGTTSPTHKLHLAESNGTALKLDCGSGSYVNIAIPEGEINLFSSSWGGWSGGGVCFGTPRVALGGNWLNPSMFINSNGNIGIGTLSPTQKLQVTNGNLYIYRDNANSPSGVMMSQYYAGFGDWIGGVYVDYYGGLICSASGYTHGMFFVGGRTGFDNFIFTNQSKSPLAKIDYNGNFVAVANISAGSDLRWKEHITDFDDNGILKALTPVEWDWKEGHGKGHASGFIAQDIQKIMPYAVGGSEEEGYVLNYNCFHALWAKSLQNHETRVEYLERRVKELETQLKQLKA